MKIEIKVNNGFRTSGELLRGCTRAVISTRGRLFRTKRQTPRSYRLLGVIGSEFANAYNSGLMTIYKAKDKTLSFEMYLDWSFLPYYGKIEFIE